MKAQGYVPESFELRGEIESVEQLVAAATDPHTAADLRQQLRVARLRLDWLEERNGSTPALREYRGALIARASSETESPAQ